MAPDTLAKDQAFWCPVAHGVVLPGEKKCVSVFFHPETLDIRTMDYLSIMPSGGASQTLLKLVGFCRGTGNPRSLPPSGDPSSSGLGLASACSLPTA